MTEETPKQPLRILLVEDNLLNQKVATITLKRHGHLTAVAENGFDALELIKENFYDIIMMDLQMPGMDGFEASERIREYEALHTPGRKSVIIAVTANTLSADRDKCIESGMDDYLSKPFTNEQLLEVIRKYF